MASSHSISFEDGTTAVLTGAPAEWLRDFESSLPGLSVRDAANGVSMLGVASPDEVPEVDFHLWRRCVKRVLVAGGMPPASVARSMRRRRLDVYADAETAKEVERWLEAP